MLLTSALATFSKRLSKHWKTLNERVSKNFINDWTTHGRKEEFSCYKTVTELILFAVSIYPKCKWRDRSISMENLRLKGIDRHGTSVPRFQGGTSVVVPYCYLFLLSVFILWFSYYVSDIFCKF